jgi:hypothetical protein
MVSAMTDSLVEVMPLEEDTGGWRGVQCGSLTVL